MYDSGRFGKRDIIEWEDKPTANKTMATAMIYFERLVKSREKHQRLTNNTAAKNGSESAANVAEKVVEGMKDMMGDFMSRQAEEVKTLKQEHLLQLKVASYSAKNKDTEMQAMKE